MHYLTLSGLVKPINYKLCHGHGDEETIEFAAKFIDFGILKQKSFDDCQHIAAAIIAGCDIITSGNFKHIVNVKMARGVKTITTIPLFVSS